MLSKALEKTLHRTLGYANERRHEYATLEHLLLALIDDPDAIQAFRACRVDLTGLAAELRAYIRGDLASLITNEETDAKPTASFQRVLQRAAIRKQEMQPVTDVTGADVLLSLFSEPDSSAVYFLKRNGMDANDIRRFLTYGTASVTSEPELNLGDIRRASRIPSKQAISAIRDEAKASALNAPSFEATHERIHFRQGPATSNQFAERKAFTSARCDSLMELCARRSNEQPEFKKIVDTYSGFLNALSETSGAYELHLAGLDIQTFIKLGAQLPVDPDRNVPLDREVLFAAQSLMVAHATLVSLYPDIQRLSDELDRYQRQADAIDALRDRVLDPVLGHLMATPQLFDEETLALTRKVARLNDNESLPWGSPPTVGATATKHSWLRGSLAAIGQFFVDNTMELLKEIRNALAKKQLE